MRNWCPECGEPLAPNDGIMENKLVLWIVRIVVVLLIALAVGSAFLSFAYPREPMAISLLALTAILCMGFWLIVGLLLTSMGIRGIRNRKMVSQPKQLSVLPGLFVLAFGLVVCFAAAFLLFVLLSSDFIRTSLRIA